MPPAQAAPGNDDFSNAQVFSSELPQEEFSSNEAASKQAGEPNHAGNAGGHSVWYSWTPSSSGPVAISTCAFSNLDTLLAVYTGGSVNALTPVASNDDSGEGCESPNSDVEFTATAGTTYLIAVDGKNGSEGSFRLGLTGPPQNDDFANADSLEPDLPAFEFGSNELASKQAGEPNHAGNAGGHSVWYTWTPSASGPVVISTCDEFSGLDTLLAVYTGSSVNSLTPVASNDDSVSECESGGSEVEFTATAGTTYRIAVDGKDESQGSFDIELTGVPANDNFANAEALEPSLPDFASGSTKLASKQAGEPNHAGNAGGHSVWYSWTPSSSGPVGISTCSFSGIDTLLAVYTGSAVNSLSPVTSNDDSAECSGGLGSEVEFSAIAGTTYRIAVDGKGGAQGSFELELAGSPFNDDFANAQSIGSGLPNSASGSTKLASKQAGEPNHAGNAGGHSVWFKWTPSTSGPVAISACGSFGSSFDTLLAVYTGSAVNGLAPVASNDDANAFGCSSTPSEVEFTAAAGTTYRIAVDGAGGSQGSFSLQLQGRPANDDFASAQSIGATLPSSTSGTTKLASKQSGEPNHAGNAGGHSVWYSWTPSSSGMVGISTCSFSLDTLLAVYTGSAVNSLTPVASNDNSGTFSCGSTSSEVQLNVTAGTTYMIAVDGRGGAQGSFELKLTGPPANDDFANAQPIGAGPPESVFGTTKLATKQAGEPNHAGDAGGHSVWYSWTPSSSGTVRVSTCDTSFSEIDTLLAVYTGSSVNSLTPIASNDDSPSGDCSAADSEVQFAAIAGTTYRIAVDAIADTVGSFRLDVTGRPQNDDFANSHSLGSSLPVSDFEASNRLATKQAGEPNHAGNAGGHSVWYTWTPSSSGSVHVSTCSFSGLDTLLAVYTGSAVNGLTPIAGNDDADSGCGSTDSEVEFVATAGTTYRIAVDGKSGGEGEFSIRLEGRPVNDDFTSPQVVSSALPAWSFGATRHATKETGEPNHAGNAGGHSVWYTWTPSTSGQVDVSTCSFGEVDTLLAVYTGSAVNSLTPVASNDDGSGGCGSNDSAAAFSATAGTTYRIAVDGKGGTEGSFELRLRGAPANDSFAKAQALASSGSSSVFPTNKLATKEAGEPNHAGNAGGHSIWYTWTPSSSGQAAISTCSFESLDTLLAVYTGSAVNGLTPVASSDDSASSCESSDSSLEFSATAGTTYRIAVDGKAGSQGSFSLTLSARPANDDFAQAQALNFVEGSSVSSSNRFATKQAGEPNHAGNAGGHSVWYTWTPSNNGPVEFSTCVEGTLDTLLAVYTGSAVNGLTPVASNDDSPGVGCSSTDSKVTFSASAGTTYSIAVDGKGGGVGGFYLSSVIPPRNDDFSHPRAISSQGGDFIFGTTKLASKQAGEPNHAGNAGGHSVWFKWTPAVSGQVSIDSCDGSLDTLLAVYTGSAVNSLTPVASNDDGGGSCGTSSKLSFTAVAGTTYRIAVDGKGGQQGSFSLSVVHAPGNDDFAAAHIISGSLPRFASGTTRLATKQAGEPNHAGNAGGHSIWFSWTPSSTGMVTLDTCFNDFDTLLAVYTGSAVNGLTPVASNDDGVGECSPGSSVSFEAIAATNYMIAVDGADGDDGRVELDLEAASVPQHSLTVAKAGNGGGSITSSPAGVNCGATCSHDFDEGTMVTLTASPDSSSTFTGWSGGGCSGNGGCQVELDSDVSVTATFTENPPDQKSLTVSKLGSGSGSITSSPAGISCGPTCGHAFDEGTMVTLTATPDSGSTFTAWSGGGCSGAGTCQITIDADLSVTATFDAKSSDGGGGGGGGAPAGSGGQTGSAAPSAPGAPIPASVPKAKTLKCKPGFKKTKVRGKFKCVKKKGKRRKH